MLDSALVMYKSQDQSIVNSNHSDVYATKAVRSLDKGYANDYFAFGERRKRNKFITRV